MSNQYYIWVDHMQVPVTEEVYRAYKRSRWRENKRTRYRINVERSFEVYREAGFDVPDDELVEEIVEDSLLLEALLEALKTLTTDERALVDTLFYAEKTEREAAQILGIHPSTVHKRKMNVLSKLKKIFD